MRFRISRRSALYPATLFTCLACGNAAPSTTVTRGSDQAKPGAAKGNTTALDGAGDAFTSDGEEASCGLGSRAASRVPAGEVPVAGSCGSAVAASTFRSALCSCEDTHVAGFLRTRSFKSQSGSSVPDQLGGSVGVNRDYTTGGFADVGGNFVVAGPRDVLFGGFLQTGGDLRFHPDFDVAGFVDVGQDAWLGGDLRAVGSIAVAGDLHRAQDSRSLGFALLRVGGSQQRGDVVVPAPCGCEPDQLLDVAGLVAEARTANDNASIGLDPHGLDLVAGFGTILTLPTGRFYVHQIAGVGALRVRISGKTALFIDDDLIANGLFNVSVDPGAEVDIFVKDNLVLAGATLLGDPARPSATRVYVGGGGDIALAGLNAFAGNVYAPTANILVGGIGRVFGSLFGKNIISAGLLDVGYDASILDGGEGCPPVGGPGSPPGGNPGGGNPGGDTPGGGNPGGDTPGTPGGGTPGGDTPGGGNPGGDTPGGGTPSDPGNPGPGGDTPGGTPPGDVPACPPSPGSIVR